MGSPKALLLYNDRTFLEHLLDITRHPKICSQIIVLGAGAEAISERVGLNPEQVVVNPDWQNGQLSSIKAAVKNIGAKPTDWSFALPRRSSVDYFCAGKRSDRIVLPHREN